MIINGSKLVFVFQIIVRSQETFQQVYLVDNLDRYYCLLFVPLWHAPQVEVAQAKARDIRQGEMVALQDRHALREQSISRFYQDQRLYNHAEGYPIHMLINDPKHRKQAQAAVPQVRCFSRAIRGGNLY